jgi:hypothetical protein
MVSMKIWWHILAMMQANSGALPKRKSIRLLDHHPGPPLPSPGGGY